MHPEALTKAGAKLLPQLRDFGGFYLAGGTALALQIGHRMSVDFDFFSTEDIPKGLFAKVQRVFPHSRVTSSVNDVSELTVLVDEVKITFLKYPFRVMKPFVESLGLHLLSVKEIAATKAYTIGRRGALKDYIDMYFVIAEKHTSLSETIALADLKFGSEFNSRLFLEQLAFLEDLEDIELMLLRPPVSLEDLGVFFGNEISRIVL